MTKPLISSSVADALAECYKNGSEEIWDHEEKPYLLGTDQQKSHAGGGNFCAAEMFFFIKFLHEFQF